VSTYGFRPARQQQPEPPDNPWLTLDEPVVETAPAPPAEFVAPEVRPNSGIAPPPPENRLPTRRVDGDELDVSLWWLSAHGGAGETTLASLVDGTRAAGHAWPVAPAGAPPRHVVLLGRTSLDGLTAVQHALAHWGSGQLAVDLKALVLLADAPGKLPRPLRDFARLLQRAAPGPSCLIPWQPAWRLGEAQPSDVRKHLKSITPKEEPQ
jgi:hypothetical protein